MEEENTNKEKTEIPECLTCRTFKESLVLAITSSCLPYYLERSYGPEDTARAINRQADCLVKEMKKSEV